MRKSQSSTEFMIFIGIAIIILMSYFAVSNSYLNLIYRQKDVISGQDLAKQIKNEINLASRVENNYMRTFQLPEKIGDKDYEIEIINREVIIRIDDLDYVELLTINIDENPGLEQGDTVIIERNSDGQVIISKS